MSIQNDEEEYYDENEEQQPKTGHKIKQIVKRGLLTVVIPLTYLLVRYRNAETTFVIVFVISMILFWNFPIIVTISNSKPTYYEDLFINTKALPKLELDHETISTFENFYTIFKIFTNSLLTSVLAEYWVFKTQYTDSIYEIIGITGGILQIFQIVNTYSGILILKIIKLYIKNKIKIYDEETFNENRDVEVI